MQEAPLHPQEADRLASLHRLAILDTPAEERFDRITRLAQQLFNVPIALVSLVDMNRQWFKSCIGLDVSETSRGVAFCAHALLSDDLLIIPDTLDDPRFADNPLVTGDPFIRFYAGKPLRGPDGLNLGTLCIIDRAPRQLSEADKSALHDLGILAQQELQGAELHTLAEAAVGREGEVRSYAAQLHLAAQVAQAATQSVEPQLLMNNTVRLIQDRFNLYYAQFYLYDAATNQLRLQSASGAVGEQLLARGHAIPLAHPTSVVAQAAREGRSLAINDVRASATFLPNELLPDTRAEAAVPLLSTEGLLGVLDVQAAESDRFHEADLDVLQTLAGQIAASLETARVFRAQKEAEQEVRALAARQSAILNNANVSVITTDPEGHILSANPTALRWLGYSEAEVLGQTPALFHDLGEVVARTERLNAEVLDEPIEPGFDTFVVRAVREQIADENEWSYIRKDGSRFPVFLSVTALRDDDDKITGFMGIATDLTERKKVEGERARLSTVVEATPDFIGIATMDGVPVYVNRGGRRMVGLPDEGALPQGMSVPNFHPEWAAQQMMELSIPQAVQHGSWVGEGALSTVDGREIPVSQVVVAHYDAAGEVQHLALVARDIRQAKAAEESLRVSEARLVKTTDNAPGMIYQFVLHPDGRAHFPFASAWVEETFGISREALRESAAPLIALIHPDDLESFQASVAHSAQTMERWDWSGRFRSLGGDYLWAQALSQPEPLGDDGTLLWNGVLTDITQETLAKEASARAAGQLHSAAEVVRQASAQRDPEALLQTTVALLQERFDLYYAQIYTLDPQSQQLRLRSASGEAGEKLQARGHAIPLAHPTSIVAQAAREGRSLAINDVRASDTFLPNELLPDTRAEAAVPLIGAGDVLVGVLDVQHDVVGRFDETDLDVLQTLAGQIAASLETARAFRAQQQAEAELRALAARQSAILNSANLSVITTDAEGHILSVNPTALRWLGYSEAEVLGQTPALFHDLGEVVARTERLNAEVLDEPIEPGFDTFVVRAARENVADENEWSYIRKDGSRFPVFLSVTALRDGDQITGYVGIAVDISERKQVEAVRAQQAALDALRAEVNRALVEHTQLAPALQGVAEALVGHLDAAFARVWTLNDAQQTLHLQASAGMYTHLDGPHGVVPVGKFKIGLIAAERAPHLTNQVVGDPRVGDQSWAAREGMVAFAGYPLMVGERLLGVIALFARHALDESTLRALNEVASTVALDIQRKESQTARDRLANILEVTPDFVATALPDGSALFLNRSARQLLALPDEGYTEGFYMAKVHPAHALVQIEGEGVPTTLERGSWQGETALLGADGAEVPVSMVMFAHNAPDNSVEAISIIARDISGQKQTQASLEQSATQLRTAADLAAQINAIRETESLLDETVTQLQARFDLYHAHVYLLDEGAGTLVVRSGTGEVGAALKERAHSIPLERPQSLVARAARERRAIVVNDVIEEPGFLANPLLPDTRAEAAVPLLVGDRVIGVLDVQDSRPHRFAASDVDLLRALAGQIATALDNAALFEQVQHSLAQTEVRLKVSQALTAARTQDQVLAAMVEQASFLPEAYVIFAEKVAGTEGHFTVQRSEVFESGMNALPDGMVVTEEIFPFLRYLSPTEPFISGDIYVDERLTHDTAVIELSRQVGTRSLAIFPIQHAGEHWGLFAVVTPTPHFFDDPRRLYLYQSLVTQGALALHTARLSDQVEESLSQTEVRLAISQALADARGEEAVLDVLVSHATLLPQTQFIISQRTPEGPEEFRLRRFVSFGSDAPPLPANMPLNRKTLPFLAYLSDTEPFIVSDVLADSRLITDEAMLQLAKARGTRSVAIFPVQYAGELWGMIAATSKEVAFFDEPQRRYLYQSMAEQGAVAIHAAYLSDQVEESLSQTEVRLAISQALATAQSESEVLDRMVEQAALFQANQVTLALMQSDETLLIARSDAFASGAAVAPVGMRLPREVAVDPILGFIERGDPLAIPDLTADSPLHPAVSDLMRRDGLRSVVSIPLVAGREFLGMMTVGRTTTGTLDPNHLYLYQSLAQQGANALRAARLFDETQRAAEELRELDRLKSEFLANMSHELRTPLNSIIGYTELMLMGANGELDEETLEDVRAISKSGKHLLHLINDILDLAKIEAGRMQLELEAIRVGELFSMATVSASSLLRSKNVQLRTEMEAELPAILADRIRLMQVLNNLVSNAVKFTEEGQILLRAHRDSDFAIIEVRDTGIGMTADEMAVIWDQFRQADNSATRRAGGTGLGLAITRSLMDLHGGSIEVESEPGVGSTFRIRVPLADVPASEQLSPAD